MDSEAAAGVLGSLDDLFEQSRSADGRAALAGAGRPRALALLLPATLDTCLRERSVAAVDQLLSVLRTLRNSCAGVADAKEQLRDARCAHPALPRHAPVCAAAGGPPRAAQSRKGSARASMDGGASAPACSGCACAHASSSAPKYAFAAASSPGDKRAPGGAESMAQPSPHVALNCFCALSPSKR
jgi:hypothetical protein